MPITESRQKQVDRVVTKLQLPPNILLRCWSAEDAPAIEHLSTRQGWPTPQNRPEETLNAWQHSWPALVLVEKERLIGFVRGITDGEITMCIGELLVDPLYRRQGLGRLLLDACHLLFPH